MADLSQLYKVAPNTAAFMTGGQQATDDQQSMLDQQKLQQLIQGLQQSNQQAAVMNPLLVQQQQGVNQAQQQKIDLTAATQPGVINKDNATNADVTTGANIDRAGKVSQFFTSTAQKLDGVPPPARIGVLTGLMKEAGLDPSDPQASATFNTLSNIPPEQLPDKLRDIAKATIQQSPGYTQAADVEKLKAASAEKVGAAHDAARISSANITAAALRDRAVTMANSKIKATPGFWDNYAKLKEPRQQISALLGEIAKVGVDTPEGQQMSVMVKALTPVAQAQLNAAQPKPGTADVNSLGLPTNPSIDLTSGVPGLNKPKTGTTKSGAKYTIIN